MPPKGGVKKQTTADLKAQAVKLERGLDNQARFEEKRANDMEVDSQPLGAGEDVRTSFSPTPENVAIDDKNGEPLEPLLLPPEDTSVKGTVVVWVGSNRRPGFIVKQDGRKYRFALGAEAPNTGIMKDHNHNTPPEDKHNKFGRIERGNKIILTRHGKQYELTKEYYKRLFAVAIRPDQVDRISDMHPLRKKAIKNEEEKLGRKSRFKDTFPTVYVGARFVWEDFQTQLWLSRTDLRNTWLCGRTADEEIYKSVYVQETGKMPSDEELKTVPSLTGLEPTILDNSTERFTQSPPPAPAPASAQVPIPRSISEPRTASDPLTVQSLLVMLKELGLVKDNSRTEQPGQSRQVSVSA